MESVATRGVSRRVRSRRAFCLLVVWFWASGLNAQTPEEHASHHPDQAAGASPAAAAMPAGEKPPGGMMEGMGEMMKGMGNPPGKEMYPALMALPELTPEKRREVEQQAAERMSAGSAMIAKAIERLNRSAQAGDYSAMEQATARLREGTTQMESGVAARRALAEGRAPREVALAWFRREMNLSLGTARPTHHGITPFHLFTMILLVGFAVAMLVLYYLKMRRAAALFGRIEGGKGPPPPGSAPELSGGKPPSPDKPSSGDKGPRSGGEPPTGSTPLSGGAPADAPRPAASAAARDTRMATAAEPPATPNESPPPLTANWRGQLRVGSIIPETDSVKTIRLLPASGQVLPFTFVPGQFLNMAFWIGGARMNRSYSISSSPTQRKYLEVTVRREPRGAVSRHVVDLLKPGDMIEAGGPVGKFTFDGTEADSIVLIGGGVGVTPMMSIARYLTERAWPGEIFFIFSCRTPADIIFKDELATLAQRNPKLHVAITISKADGAEWKGHRGRIDAEWLKEIVPNLTSRRFHICGPPTMMDGTKALLLELGVPAEQVKMESFGTPKPPPAAAGTTVKPRAPADGPLVTFSKNNKASRIHVGQTILELSEELGIGIQYSCRVGTCGVCKVKMTSGEVDMEVEDSLDADDKANGIILACQAKAKTPVTIEA